MKYKDPITGEYKELFLKASDTLPIGSIVPYGSNDIPANWLLCDGRAVSRTTYANLFSVIGTNFGEGDGTTTFNLPDFRSRVPVGLYSEDIDFDTIGDAGGEKEHTLIQAELPNAQLNILDTSYGWTVNVGGGNVEEGSAYPGVPLKADPSGRILKTSPMGSGQSHNNLQPYQVVNYIIKSAMSVGVIGNVLNNKSDSKKDTYSCNYLNKAIKEVYSTEEQIIGKWIDGKPIYRKCYSGSCSGLTNILDNTYKNGDIVFTNCGGSISQTNGTRRMNLGGYINSNWNSGLYLAEQGIILYVSSELTQGNFELFIEYTKTTDSGINN